MSMRRAGGPPGAVTFDCWSTLLYEPEPAASYGRRVEIVTRAARAWGLGADAEAARRSLDRAWQRHWALWHEGVASGAREMAAWAVEVLLEERGGRRPEAEQLTDLTAELAEAALGAEVRALDGALETLERLAAAGVRRALICDTGFSPGRVVRRLLDRAGLLPHLEATVFSDEAGVPKPDTRVFRTALDALGFGERADEAVHVGDLRRTDVAGARAAGLRTVRIRDHHDDRSELPDADHVADSHVHLLEILGLGGSPASALRPPRPPR